jgi:hypothetical protein
MQPRRTDDAETINLLEEGARSYPEAVVALMAFRREVFNRCREVVISQLSALGEAFGDAIKRDDVHSYGENVLYETELSVLVRNDAMRTKRIEFFAGLCWGEGHGFFAIYSGLWVPTRLKGRLEKTINEFNEESSKLNASGFDENGVYFALELNPDEAGSFDIKLKDLICRWISLGKKCGGFLKLLTENA